MSATRDEQDGLLSEEQIEELTGHLRAGRRIPPHLLPHLFETSKEYQLAYAGKARRADILSDTMAVPLQSVKTFGEADVSWSNMLILGDNLQVLRRLLQMKDAGELRSEDGTDGVRLCYIDPPFATGEAWETRAGRVAYVDRVKGAEFLEWLRRRLILICELLATNGALLIHLDQRYAHYMKVVMDELLPGNFRNEIIVPRGIKGVQSQFDTIDALAQGHYSLLFYSKTAGTRFEKLLDPGAKPSRWDTFWLGTDRPTMRYELFGTTPTSGQWRWSRAKAEGGPPTTISTSPKVAQYRRLRGCGGGAHRQQTGLPAKRAEGSAVVPPCKDEPTRERRMDGRSYTRLRNRLPYREARGGCSSPESWRGFEHGSSHPM